MISLADRSPETAEGNRVQIRYANAEFKVAGQGIEDFPTLREYDFKGWAVPVEFFRAMIAA